MVDTVDEVMSLVVLQHLSASGMVLSFANSD